LDSKKTVAIIGGGAAGFFFAANVSHFFPDLEVHIYEQAKQGLQKVKISGGGRCNVTHYCFDPVELATHYPRGEKELIGPFHRFGPQDTIDWFEQRKVPIKKEADGRMFPKSNQSQSIIDCLLYECESNGVQIFYSKKVKFITPLDNGSRGYEIEFLSEQKMKFDYLMLSTGSSKSIWKMLNEIGFVTNDPVPSLFTFKIQDKRLEGLAGVSVQEAIIQLVDSKHSQSGPLLITHKGLSGPSALKLSAFGALDFAKRNYKTSIIVNFLPTLSIKELKAYRDEHGKQLIKEKKWDIPKRLTQSLLTHSPLDLSKKWASLSNSELEIIYDTFCKASFTVNGQNTFKEEFVTAGGIDLNEINFKNFSSKRFQNLFFAGEILNIDAVTGGFNFQAAWTGAYLAAIGLSNE